jgi:hypothetical protein
MKSSTASQHIVYESQNRETRTPEEIAETVAGFPERIVGPRPRKTGGHLSVEEDRELDGLQSVLERVAPDLLPPE